MEEEESSPPTAKENEIIEENIMNAQVNNTVKRRKVRKNKKDMLKNKKQKSAYEKQKSAIEK